MLDVMVAGTGLVNNRRIVVGGEDFSIKGGSPTTAGYRKSVYTETLALEMKLPLVRLHEGGGGSVSGAGSRRDKSSMGSSEDIRVGRRSLPSVAQECSVAAWSSAIARVVSVQAGWHQQAGWHLQFGGTASMARLTSTRRNFLIVQKKKR